MPGFRAVYLFGDPRNAVASIFRRELQVGHFRWLRMMHEPPPEALARLRSLEAFVEAGVDEFMLDDHVDGWLQPGAADVPVLAVRYEAMAEAWPVVCEFVGLPADHPCFQLSGRTTDWRAAAPRARRSRRHVRRPGATARGATARRAAAPEMSAGHRPGGTVPGLIEFQDDTTFVIDGIEFVSEFHRRTTSTRFSILKPRDLVEAYEELCHRLDPKRIVEVGTFARDHLPPREQWPELIFELPELRYPEKVNCAGVLLDDAIAEGCGDHVALRSVSQAWTYSELLAKSNQIAQVLVQDLGLVAGNRVLLRGTNMLLFG